MGKLDFCDIFVTFLLKLLASQGVFGGLHWNSMVLYPSTKLVEGHESQKS